MVALALGLFLLIAFVHASILSTSGGGDFIVTIDPTASLSAPLPSDFASISAEVQCASQFIAAADNSYINLMMFLTNASGGTRGPNIRIGGHSADRTWYSNQPNATLPRSVSQKIKVDLVYLSQF